MLDMVELHQWTNWT